MSPRVTIHDVARLAKVSPSTVSNFFNERTERMRPETLARVQSAIVQLSYSPNRVARNLKTGQVRMLGVIVPSVANPFYGAFAYGIERAALARGYQVLLGNSERDPERERRFAEELWGYGVRGLISGSSPLALSHLATLVEHGLTIVAFDRQATAGDDLAVDSVTVDNVLAARLATEHLLKLGHRRIGLVTGPLRTVNRHGRLQGYQNALQEYGVTADSALIWEKALEKGFGDTEGVELGRSGARELLSKPNRPTGLVAINDMYAYGAYIGARDLGLRVPGDVSIVGIDDGVLSEVVSPPLTTVRQPLAEMTQAAVDIIIARIERKDDSAQHHIVMKPELIVRHSTAARAARH